MSPHILYCNDRADILVLDLPTSISRSQASTLRLRSTPAREVPYLTPEPKGAKRDAVLSQIPDSERDHHNQLRDSICAALRVLGQEWPAPIWCLPRIDVTHEQLVTERSCPDHHGERMVRDACPPLVLSSSTNNVCCSSAFVNVVVHNPSTSSADFVISSQGRFVIPPKCTFLNASVADGLPSFQTAIPCLLPRQSFDLILLDPPWSNRSVRNKKAYQSAENQSSDPFENVFPKAVTYLSDKGYVAVWITNKAAIRSQVKKICYSHGLVLKEEWIWLKITAHGEPISPLDGLWKRPYELLLLFGRGPEPNKIVRRLGIAVPDVHSRKPSLKSMFEQLLPKDYNALEIFARSLTAGWWAWGDEVLKFQHENNWY